MTNLPASQRVLRLTVAIFRFSNQLMAVALAFFCASAAFGNETPEAVVKQTAGTAPPHRLYVTREQSEGWPELTPVNSFDCSESVYAVLESDTLAEGTHKFQVLWMDPDGKERERVEYDFDASPSTRIWGWLRLHRGAGGTLMSVFDPAAGMEEMIGTWTARFHLDGEFLQASEFEILC